MRRVDGSALCGEARSKRVLLRLFPAASPGGGRLTGTQMIDTDPGDGIAEMIATYRRLATMDPPALRSLAAELERLSEESSASAALQAATARAALASVGSEI